MTACITAWFLSVAKECVTTAWSTMVLRLEGGQLKVRCMTYYSSGPCRHTWQRSALYWVHLSVNQVPICLCLADLHRWKASLVPRRSPCWFLAISFQQTPAVIPLCLSQYLFHMPSNRIFFWHTYTLSLQLLSRPSCQTSHLRTGRGWITSTLICWVIPELNLTLLIPLLWPHCHMHCAPHNVVISGD